MPVKDLKPFRLQRTSSPVGFRQVQNSLHQVQKHVPCFALRSVSKFQCTIVSDQTLFRQLKFEKQNRIKIPVITNSQQQQQKTIHHFSMRPKHHERSKQLGSHCRRQFQTNLHSSNQHASECSDTDQSPWLIGQPSTCCYW